MTLDDIRKQAEREGIPISEYTFRKHVNQGLFCGTYNPIGGREGSNDATYDRGMETLRLISKWKKPPFRYKPGEMIILLYCHGLPVKLDKLYDQLQAFHLIVKQTLEEAEDHLNLKGIGYREDRRAELLPKFSASRSGPLPHNVRKMLDEAVQEEVDTFLAIMDIFASLQREGRLNLAAFSRFVQLDLSPMISSITQEDLNTFLALPLFQKSIWNQMMDIRTDPLDEKQHSKQMAIHLDAFRQQVKKHWIKLLNSPLGQSEDMQHMLRLWSKIQVNENHLTDVIGLMRPLLYVWIASGASTWLLEWLQRPETIEKWNDALHMPHYSQVRPLIDVSDLSVSPFLKGGDSHESTHS